MRCILSRQTDIYFQLACEEFLLRSTQEEVCLVWPSEKSIVVGKHQNAMAEINHAYVYQNQIPVARRISGGGTVYHGPGNINFTFIRNGEPGKLVNFGRYLAPVIEFLKSKGTDAEIGSKNELLVNGIKVSGNAEHIFKQRVLHHGTLLYEADLSELNECIRVKPGRYRDKAVQSNRSQVINLKQIMTSMEKSTEVFMQEFFDFLCHRVFTGYVSTLSPEENSAIRELRDSKFVTWEWNFGYSPTFEYVNSGVFLGKPVHVSIQIEKGLIRKIECHGHESLQHVVEPLIGCAYDYLRVKENLEQRNHTYTEALMNLLF